MAVTLRTKIILGSLVVYFVSWPLVWLIGSPIIRSKYDKTVETRLTSPVAYTTLAFFLNKFLVSHVTLDILDTTEKARESVSLSVYTSIPPLNVHRKLPLFIDSKLINGSSQFVCYQFYLHSGSFMNWTFFAAVPMNYSVVRGNGIVNDYYDIHPPLSEIFRGSSGSFNTSVQYSSFYSNSDLYHFCVAANETVSVRNISFLANSLQYRLNASDGNKCKPSVHSSCTLSLSDEIDYSNPVAAIVEVTSKDTDPDSPDIRFTIHISCNFEVLEIAPLSLGFLLFLVLLVLIIKTRLIPAIRIMRRRNRTQVQRGPIPIRRTDPTEETPLLIGAPSLNTEPVVEDSSAVAADNQRLPPGQDEGSESVAADVPEDKKFKPKDVKFGSNYDRIGGGGFGDIYKAVLKVNGKDTVVALKKARGGLPLTARELSELDKEANILLAIPSHEHVVTIIGVCCGHRDYAIILEFIDGGDLRLLLCPTENSDSYLDGWSNRLDMARQIADGMNHIHSLSPPVIHRDLKPANVLVKKTSVPYCCKITDFGLAKMRSTSNQIAKRDVGSGFNASDTLAYVAPERFGSERLDKKQETKLDVYSFGVILWQFRERRFPFDEKLDHVIVGNVKAGVPFCPPKRRSPDGYADLTKHCCALKPDDRPSFSGISNSLRQLLADVRSDHLNTLMDNKLISEVLLL